MPELTDPATRAKILTALVEWGSDGLLWDPVAEAWLRQNLGNLTQARVWEILRLWVAAGKKIRYADETREEWREKYKVHYDFEIHIGGKTRYIETRLIDHSRVNPPRLLIANMHDSQ